MPDNKGAVFLGRRDKDKVVLLNSLPEAPDGAFNISVPLTKKDSPAARYLTDGVHLVEGLDYQDRPILAAVLSVPRTEWIIIATMATTPATRIRSL